MNTLSEFESRLSPDQRTAFRSLTSPAAIQAYLDGIPYVAEERDRSPLAVLQDRQAHCLDGGIFAALALWRLGHRPLILDLVPEPGKDDDHVLALFRHKRAWGAIAKSNYVGLRYREPVYRDLRELAMTYFEWYTSLDKQKTLRAHTRPLDLARLERFDWAWDEDGIRQVSRRLYRLKPIRMVAAEADLQLSPADERAYAANTQGTNFDWVYGVRPNP
jgi:hypothetical protein